MLKRIVIGLVAVIAIGFAAFGQAGSAPYPSAFFAQGGTTASGLHWCGSTGGFPIFCPSPGGDMTAGTVLASAGTIAPVAGVTHISGTAAIATITVPVNFITGQIVLIPDAVFTTTTGGNISLASTAVVNKALILTYDGVKWNPSY